MLSLVPVAFSNMGASSSSTEVSATEVSILSSAAWTTFGWSDANMAVMAAQRSNDILFMVCSG
jgi:hypothetical protein